MTCVNCQRPFKRRPNGATGCHECYKRYTLKRAKAEYAQVRQALTEYKERTGCACCGYKAHHAALQFDHIIPILTKKRVAMTSLKKLQDVINDPNIQLLCANCHGIKTFQDGVLQRASKV